MYRFAAPAVDEQESGVVTRDKTGSRKNEITDTSILECLIDAECAFSAAVSEMDIFENVGGIKIDSVKGNLN